MNITFPTYKQFAAVYIDGKSVGYMEHDGVTLLHLGKTAPKWLQDVRAGGPYQSHRACQEAVVRACPALDFDVNGMAMTLPGTTLPLWRAMAKSNPRNFTLVEPKDRA